MMRPGSGKVASAMEFSSMHTFNGCHVDSVNCLAFSPDGRFLASGADDCVVFIYDYKNGCDTAKIVTSSSVTALLWHPAYDPLLLVGYANGDIQLIDPLNPVGGTVPVGIRDPIECMAYEPINRYLAVGAGAQVLVCQMSKKYVLVEALNICPSTSKQGDMLVRSVHFVGCGHLIVITYLEHGIICWDIPNNKLVWNIIPRTSRTGQSTISADEKYIVVSNLLDGFDVYDLQNLKFLRTISDFLLENVIIPVVFLSNSHDYVLVGSSNGAVKILDISSGAMICLLTHHNWDMVQTIAYYHDIAECRHYIASATSEKGLETYITVWRGMDVSDPLLDDEATPEPLAASTSNSDETSVQHVSRKSKRGIRSMYWLRIVLPGLILAASAILSSNLIVEAPSLRTALSQRVQQTYADVHKMIEWMHLSAKRIRPASTEETAMTMATSYTAFGSIDNSLPVEPTPESDLSGESKSFESKVVWDVRVSGHEEGYLFATCPA